MKKITDRQRLAWLANCQVVEGEMVFSKQFELYQEKRVSKTVALRQAIDVFLLRGDI